MTGIPEWIQEYIQEARGLYGLGGPDWHFFINLVKKPGGSKQFSGCTHTDLAYKNANIDLKDDLEDNETSRENIHHEVLHVAHNEIDGVVASMIANLPKDKRDFFREMYHDASERHVQTLARCICHHVMKRDSQE